MSSFLSSTGELLIPLKYKNIHVYKKIDTRAKKHALFIQDIFFAEHC
jgi:hypothetical protein